MCDLFFLLARSPYTVLLSHWIRTPATMFAFATMSHFITHQFATDANGNTSNTAEHPGRRVVVFGLLSFLSPSFLYGFLSLSFCQSPCSFLSLGSSWMSMLILTNSVVSVNLPHLYRRSFRILLSFFSIWRLMLHFFCEEKKFWVTRVSVSHFIILVPLSFSFFVAQYLCFYIFLLYWAMFSVFYLVLSKSFCQY